MANHTLKIKIENIYPSTHPTLILFFTLFYFLLPSPRYNNNNKKILNKEIKIY